MPKLYPVYKPSGVEWLGEVPAHWKVLRLQISVSDCVGGVWGFEPDGVDDLPCIRVADFDRRRLRVRMDSPTLRSIKHSDRNRRVLSPGDLLLEKSGGGDLQPVGVVMLYDHQVPAVSSNFVARLQIAPEHDPVFLTYLHSTLYAIRLNARAIKQTTGIQNLDISAYLGELVCFPPLFEQRAIAAFLDRETAKIDALISKKERLIELLQEKRSALISHTVTKGLNPNILLKHSGVEWLGKIPEHWEVKRLRYLANITTGDRDTVDRQDDGKYPFFVRSQKVERIDSWSFDGEAVLTAGDGAVGEVFHYINGKFDFHQRVYKFSNFSTVIGKFFFYYLRSMLRIRISQGTAKSTVDSLRLPMLLDFPVAAPPFSEQAAIAAFLDREMETLDNLIVKVEKANELLREFRTALISAAVTGKIDVREETECT